jgi:SAM-dependent methyltransferase
VTTDTRALDVASLNYVSFISLLHETNRPPGGKQTVRFWIQNAYLGQHSDVLEIGSNTGFTSLELARSCGCRVLGIDIAETAVEVARRDLARDVPEIRRLVRFEVGDALEIAADDGEFDAVVCGGALSFIGERQKALLEIRRVLRPWGFLCVSPLCYHTPPPPDLLDRLEAIVGFRIPVYRASEWLALLCASDLEPYVTRRVAFEDKSDEDVAAYVDVLVAECADELPPAAVEEVRDRAVRTFHVFNENRRYVEALQAVFRLRHLPEQRELFTLLPRRGFR